MGRRMKPTERIEAFLSAERADLRDQNILASNVVVIDNMLANTVNLADAYAEILTQAPVGTVGTWGEHEAWKRIMLAIIEAAAGWSPPRVSETRAAVCRVAELSEKIAKNARVLAELLRTRESHRNKHAISGPDDYHPLDVLDFAADISNQAHLYKGWIAPRLADVRADFDLKYWPSTSDFLEALADLQTASIEPYDDLSRAAMDSRQSGSPLEFVRALDAELAHLERFENIRVKFTHRTVAEIANAALALPDDGLLNSDSVKRYRARMREKAAKG